MSAAQYVELSAEYVDWLGARLMRRRLLSAAYVEPSAAWVELGLGLRLGLGFGLGLGRRLGLVLGAGVRLHLP